MNNPEEFSELPDVDAVLERRSKAELIALIKLMLRKEPELEWLLETSQPTGEKSNEPVNPEKYRRQVEAAFRRGGYEWGAVYGVAEELLIIKDIGDEFTRQGNFANAVAVYEAIVAGLTENYNSYDDEGGDLGNVLNECADELKECLINVQDDSEMREKFMQVLFSIYHFDVESGGIGIGEDVPDILVEHTTAEERQTVAGWVRNAISKQGTSDWSTGVYGGFLLELEADTLDDEAFLRISRETGRIGDAVDRLLTLGRVDEALRDAEQAGDYSLMQQADIFVKHGQDSLAERMILERSKHSTDYRLLEWLKSRYQDRNDVVATLEMALELFRKRPPTLSYYQEIRQLATQIDRWETIRSILLAYLQQSQNNYLLTKIALDEGDIDKAVEMVKRKEKPGTHSRYSYDYSYGYGAGYHTIAFDVAKAAEEARPRAALEIYQQQVERLINERGRLSYQEACRYLIKVRELYERLGENEAWTSYITKVRESNRSLRALKEELAAAKLI